MLLDRNIARGRAEVAILEKNAWSFEHALPSKFAARKITAPRLDLLS